LLVLIFLLFWELQFDPHTVSVFVCSASGNVEEKYTEIYPVDHSVGRITLNLEPGQYDYTITALSGEIEGTESARRSLSVGKNLL